MSSFFKLLFKKELTLLLGNRYKNLWILVGIIFCSLFSIGVSNGIKDYLGDKMKDPSVNFVMVEIPYGNKQFKKPYQRKKLLSQFNSSQNRNRFKYSDASKVNEGYVNLNLRAVPQCKYRLALENDVFFKRYVKKEILVPDSTSLIFDDENYSCIITDELKLKIELEYRDSIPSFVLSDHPFLEFKINDNIVPISIAGVISALPNDNSMIISKKFFDAINTDGYSESPFDIDSINHKSYLDIFTTDSKVKVALDEKYNLEPLDKSNFSDGVSYRVWTGYSDTSSFDSIYEIINNEFNVSRVYDYTVVAVEESPDVRSDYINFAFDELDSVRKFKDFLLKAPYKLKLDISTVEAKENFSLFDKISRFLSYALIAFSIVLILSYLINLVMSHLDKNERSIGTLKAFGLSNKQIIFLYTSLSIVLITISFFISYILLLLFAQLLFDLILNLFSIGSDSSLLQFQMFEIQHIILIFVVLPSLFIFYKLFFRIYKTTPGDLIYKR